MALKIVSGPNLSYIQRVNVFSPLRPLLLYTFGRTLYMHLPPPIIFQDVFVKRFPVQTLWQGLSTD